MGMAMARTSLESMHFTDFTRRAKRRAPTDVDTMRSDHIRHVAGLDESEARFSLHGEFDISNRRQLSETLEPYMASQTLTLDLTDAAFIDAGTLGVLFHVERCRREIDATRLRIVNVRPHIRRILSLCHLDEVFDIKDVAADMGKPPFSEAAPLAVAAPP
jgi:anti-anti-sigma factor